MPAKKKQTKGNSSSQKSSISSHINADMPVETSTNDSISDRDFKRLQSVEYYNQSYGSFYSTKMEKDKSILTLSVAGIGFSLTLLNTSENIHALNITLFIISSAFFLISIYAVLEIFSKNAQYITNILIDTGKLSKEIAVIEYKLSQLDKMAIYCFYIAILSTILLGLSTLTEAQTILQPVGESYGEPR